MRPHLLAIITIFMTVLHCLVHGQSISEKYQTIPELSGHAFIPNSLVSGPFTNSTFAMKLGGEFTTNLILPPLIDLPDTLRGLDGNLVFVNLGFSYQQQVKDWIAFYLELDVAVRSGTELRSLLFEGVNTVVGGRTGLLFNLWKGPRHQLSGHLSINNYNATLINLRGFVEDVINNVPDPSITRNAPALTVAAGANFAYAFSPVIGLTSELEAQYGEGLSRAETALRFRLGVSGDFNWASKGVPLGISTTFIARSTSDYVYVDREIAYTGGLKLSYTGTPDFILGIEMQYSSLPVISIPNNVNSIGVGMNIHYFFN